MLFIATRAMQQTFVLAIKIELLDLWKSTWLFVFTLWEDFFQTYQNTLLKIFKGTPDNFP